MFVSGGFLLSLRLRISSYLIFMKQILFDWCKSRFIYPRNSAMICDLLKISWKINNAIKNTEIRVIYCFTCVTLPTYFDENIAIIVNVLLFFFLSTLPAIVNVSNSIKYGTITIVKGVDLINTMAFISHDLIIEHIHTQLCSLYITYAIS